MKVRSKIERLLIGLCILLLCPGAMLCAQSVSDFVDMDSLVAGKHSLLLVNKDAVNLPPEWNPRTGEYLRGYLNENAQAVYTSALYVELTVNEPELVIRGPVGDIEIIYDIKYLDSVGDYKHEENKILQIAYDPNGNYKFRSVDVYHGVAIAYVTLQSIRQGEGTPLSLDAGDGTTSETQLTVLNGARTNFYPFQFQASLEAVPAFNLPPAVPVRTPSTEPDSLNCRYNSISGDLVFYWSNASEPRAAYTEVQWSFVNNYQSTDLPVNFKTNSTSVQIPAFGNLSSSSYSIPCVFEQGTVAYRIRWIGMDKYGRPLYGPWSSADFYSHASACPNKYSITSTRKHEADKKNWQYVAAFAEEGKHKDVVTYYDGSMRSRQAVTRLNGGQVLDGNHVIVAETIYDYQGRPAVQVLPAPVSKKEAAVSGNSNSGSSGGTGLFGSFGSMMRNLGDAFSEWASAHPAPGEIAHEAPANDLPQKLKYYSNYNVESFTFGTGYKPYTWFNFDTGAFTCPPTGIIAAPMDSSSGAALYYSKNNRDQHAFNAFLPRANGYPFVQTEYMSDNTGRIRRQGGVGKEFQIGAGHDTRFYYGVPSQKELDRFFGNDVGKASYYKKNMVVDPNGQMAVQYLDMKGDVIASALAGECPANADKLGNRWVFRDDVNLLDNQQISDVALSNVKQSSYVLLLPTASIVQFDYELDPVKPVLDICNTNWCLDCEYDYAISIYNDCGQLVQPVRRVTGIGAGNLRDRLPAFNTSCREESDIKYENFQLALDKGSYLVTRTLTVTPRSILAYQKEFDQSDICQTIKDSLSLGVEAGIPDRGCNRKCSSCTTEATAETAEEVHEVNGMRYTVPARQAGFATSCANLCDTTGNGMESYIALMLSDVSPDGMYGRCYPPKETMEESAVQPIDSLDQLSLFNTGNKLGEESEDSRRNWRYPAQSDFNPRAVYCDANGDTAWVRISSETQQVYRDIWGAEGFNKIVADRVAARMVGGTLYVRPDTLRTVEEFVKAWQPQWAKALLPYHPEYASLLLYMRDSLSNKYDDKIGKILSYNSWQQLYPGDEGVNHLLLNQDPYCHIADGITTNTAWTSLDNSLYRTMYTTPDREVPEIEYATVSATYCAVEGMEDATWLPQCVGAHITAHPLFTAGDRQDQEWRTYKGIYLNHKKLYQQADYRSKFPFTPPSGHFTRLSAAPAESIEYKWPSELRIGDTTNADNLYSKKQMRFPTIRDMFRNFDCDEPEERAALTTNELLCSAAKIEQHFKDDCNKCPTALHLEALLLGMANEGKLDSVFAENIMGYYMFRNDMRNSLGNRVVKVTWEPEITATELKVTMHTRIKNAGGSEVAGATHTVNFKCVASPPIDWRDIHFIRCLNYTETPTLYPFSAGKNFTIRFIDNKGHEYKGEGVSSCFVLNACDTMRNCTETADAGALQNLFTYLFEDRNRIKNTSGQLLCDQRVRSETEVFPIALQHFRATEDNSKNVWKWKRTLVTDNTLRGEITVSENDGPVRQRCEFTFTFFGQPGVRFGDLPFYITGLRAQREDKCTLQNFLLEGYAVVGGTRKYFLIRAQVEDGCFTISECCKVSKLKACPNMIQNPGFAMANISGIPISSNLGIGKLVGGRLDGIKIGGTNTIQSSGGFTGGIRALGHNYVRLFKPINLTSGKLEIWQTSKSFEADEVYRFSFAYKVFEGSIPTGNIQVEIDTGGGDFVPVSLFGTSISNGFLRLSGSFRCRWSGPAVLRIVYNGPERRTALAGIDNLLLEDDICVLCCPEIPKGNPPVVVDSCEQSKQYLRDFNLAFNFSREVERQRLRIGAEYTRRCLENADRFKAVLDNSVYQVTLFYYDQAGNLVKTVPPKGVDTLNTDEITQAENYRAGVTDVLPKYPDHKLASFYKYDALGQVIEKKSPDAGTTLIHYDSLGRAHLSQNALQAGRGRASYITYDDLGRVLESGECVNPAADVWKSQHAVREYISHSVGDSEVVRMYYDKPVSDEVEGKFTAGQQNLRNQVASTTFSVDGDAAAYEHATHYSYDIHGNAKELLQQNNDEGLVDEQKLKRIEYKYDLISGKTNEVWYQKEEADQYIHRYMYDADNRVTDVFSGTHPRYLENDATYIFYKHGPVARVELGQQKVQGMDYAYTLQGWLKAINSNSLLPENDIGGDGVSGAYTPADKMGFSLHYFSGDYSALSGRQSFLGASPVTDALSSHLNTATGAGRHHSLFNGNIAATVSSLKDAATPVMLNLHRYDQLQRLTGTTSLNAAAQMYKSTYAYDANGNITNMKRWQSGENPFDSLVYTYRDNEDNRLYNLKDNAGSIGAGIDISGEKNYTYDAIGNLTADDTNAISWTATGRIKQYGIHQSYAYDAAQRRVTKTNGTNKQYYVYDLQGNIMALYEKNGETLKWVSSPIYGGSRAGIYIAGKVMPDSRPAPADTLGYYRGQREYELTDHLGNVMVTVSDNKIRHELNGIEELSADTRSAQDYFPFGMQLPGRGKVATGAYPFAYNGMEQDKKEGEDGYTTEYRQYDPRVGRWMSVDPLTVKSSSKSPFNYVSNNPIRRIDVSGAEDYIEETIHSDGSRSVVTVLDPIEIVASPAHLDPAPPTADLASNMAQGAATIFESGVKSVDNILRLPSVSTAQELVSNKAHSLSLRLANLNRLHAAERLRFATNVSEGLGHFVSSCNFALSLYNAEVARQNGDYVGMIENDINAAVSFLPYNNQISALVSVISAGSGLNLQRRSEGGFRMSQDQLEELDAQIWARMEARRLGITVQEFNRQQEERRNHYEDWSRQHPNIQREPSTIGPER